MAGVEEKVIGIVRLKLYDNAEKTAERFDKLIRKLPMKYRVCLQNRIEDSPLTKNLEEYYVSDEGSD